MMLTILVVGMGLATTPVAVPVADRRTISKEADGSYLIHRAINSDRISLRTVTNGVVEDWKPDLDDEHAAGRDLRRERPRRLLDQDEVNADVIEAFEEAIDIARPQTPE